MSEDCKAPTPGSRQTVPVTDENSETPLHPLWGEQTRLAVDNFPVSGEPMPLSVIRAVAAIKQAAAVVNARLGVLDPETAAEIAAAAADIAAGRYPEQFPIDVFQTGSGTSTNMNVNEVIATLASARLGADVHPNDHVNASQSSNDVMPTAVHIAVLRSLLAGLLPALNRLQLALTEQAGRHAGTVTLGRTHLMDAVPLTIGDEFSGWAAQIAHGIERIESAIARVAEVPLGGTAVGTGLNTPRGWRDAVVTELGSTSGLALSPARNAFEAQSARDALVEMSGQLRTVAVSLTKISEDIRWKASGPAGGLGEFALPALQAGSSIMPGKVNPVIPEVVVQVAAQVVGNDAAVAWAGARGAFELNAMIPVIARNLLSSINLLTSASRLLADRCVAGIEVDQHRTRALAESSAALITALNPYLGYTEAAAIVKEASRSGRSVRELAERHIPERLSRRQLDEALDLDRIARPHQA